MPPLPPDHAVPVSGAPLARLLIRRDFLAVQAGRKAHAATLTLQARRRDEAEGAPRAGFTVTKKTGNAVRRNRIRRRLREAVRLIGTLHAKPGHDYVIVGRSAALDASFATILTELETAFARVHSDRSRGRGHRAGADEARG